MTPIPMRGRLTWLQAEAYAGPRGACTRKGVARLATDDTPRIVRAGIPDTMFSIPAYYIEKGKRVHGYITRDDDTDAFIFHQDRI